VLSQFLGEQGLMIEGPATSEVAKVRIVHGSDTGETTTYPAELYRLEPPVSDQIQASTPVEYILGFIPRSLVPPRTASTPTISLPGEPAPPPPSPGEPAPTPLKPDPAVQSALRSISVIAYDASGDEIGRQQLNGPSAEIGLYPPVYNDDSQVAGNGEK
jgi:hypothetical protein